MRAYILVEVEASDLFVDDGPNWKWCIQNATFTHKEECEFILYVPEETEYFLAEVESMKAGGCTPEFIKAYEDARKLGAAKVLFWS